MRGTAYSFFAGQDARAPRRHAERRGRPCYHDAREAILQDASRRRGIA